MPRILIADADGDLRASLERTLESLGHTFVASSATREAVEQVRACAPDAVLLEIAGASQDMEVFEEIRRIAPDLPVIIMTSGGSTELVIEATRRGAFDCALKPIQVEQVCGMLARALRIADTSEAPAAQLAPGGKRARPSQLVGSSRAMQLVYKAIGQVADSDVHVLIQGESGTGKELVARAIHAHSERGGCPFIPINCAAIPENLIESELFGHERGAFTGAVERKVGLLETSNGGTVLLDEIVELPLTTQAKLLRFIQHGEVIRVGGDAPRELDVRIIAATNTDLELAVANRQFREDLYFRLNTMTIVLPSLRKRLEDLEELVAHFVSLSNDRHGKCFTQISADVIDRLREHDWPGNVRELENVIRKAVIVGRGTTLQLEHLFPETFVLPGATAEQPAPPAEHTDATGTPERLLRRLVDEHDDGAEPLLQGLERRLIAHVLERVGGNQVRAARMLGISRNTLRNRIQRYGLRSIVAVRGARD